MLKQRGEKRNEGMYVILKGFRINSTKGGSRIILSRKGTAKKGKASPGSKREGVRVKSTNAHLMGIEVGRWAIQHNEEEKRMQRTGIKKKAYHQVLTAFG